MNWIKGKSYKTKGGWEAMYLGSKNKYEFFHYNSKLVSFHHKSGQVLNRGSQYDVLPEEWQDPMSETRYVQMEKDGSVHLSLQDFSTKGYVIAQKKITITEGEFE